MCVRERERGGRWAVCVCLADRDDVDVWGGVDTENYRCCWSSLLMLSRGDLGGGGRRGTEEQSQHGALTDCAVAFSPMSHT